MQKGPNPCSDHVRGSVHGVGVSLALGSLCARQQLQEFCGKWDGGSVGFL